MPVHTPGEDTGREDYPDSVPTPQRGGGADTWARPSNGQMGGGQHGVPLPGRPWNRKGLGAGPPAKSSQLWLLLGDVWGGLSTLPTPASWVPPRPHPKPRGLTWPRHPALRAPQAMGREQGRAQVELPSPVVSPHLPHGSLLLPPGELAPSSETLNSLSDENTRGCTYHGRRLLHHLLTGSRQQRAGQ